MSWLALDTSSDRASVAVGHSGEDAVERHADGSRTHARTLLGLVDAALDARGLVPSELTGIILADGPGSFTGLRVSAAVAKGLHDALRLPVFVASTLAGRALAALGGAPGKAIVTSDALRGDIFLAEYHVSNGSIVTVVPPTVVARHSVRVPPGAILCAQGESPIDARWLIALQHLGGGTCQPEPFSGWAPFYGRPAEAQARWEREHGRTLEHSPGVAR